MAYQKKIDYKENGRAVVYLNPYYFRKLKERSNQLCTHDSCIIKDAIKAYFSADIQAMIQVALKHISKVKKIKNITTSNQLYFDFYNKS